MLVDHADGERKMGYSETEAALNRVLDSVTKLQVYQRVDSSNRRLDVLEAHQYHTRSQITKTHGIANRSSFPAYGDTDYQVYAIVHMQGNNSNVTVTFTTSGATPRFLYGGRFTLYC